MFFDPAGLSAVWALGALLRAHALSIGHSSPIDRHADAWALLISLECDSVAAYVAASVLSRAMRRRADADRLRSNIRSTFNIRSEYSAENRNRCPGNECGDISALSGSRDVLFGAHSLGSDEFHARNASQGMECTSYPASSGRGVPKRSGSPCNSRQQQPRLSRSRGNSFCRIGLRMIDD